MTTRRFPLQCGYPTGILEQMVKTRRYFLASLLTGLLMRRACEAQHRAEYRRVDPRGQPSDVAYRDGFLGTHCWVTVDERISRAEGMPMQHITSPTLSWSATHQVYELSAATAARACFA